MILDPKFEYAQAVVDGACRKLDRKFSAHKLSGLLKLVRPDDSHP
jgi:hypothetical protein